MRPVTVARDGTMRLAAHEEDGQFCLTVSVGTTVDGVACADSSDAGVVLGVEGDSGSQSIAVAVTAAAATVEVRRAGRLLAAGPTVAGEAYRGLRAGSVRFALVRLPLYAPEDGLRIRALDAAGVVRETLAADPAELVSEHRSLLSGRSGRSRWSVTLERSSSLRPTVLDLDHEAVSRCISVTTGTADGSSSSDACFADVAPALLPNIGRALGEPRVADGCDPAFRLVHGIVDGAVSRVSVLLGDGRRVSARTAQVPSRPQVAYALAVRASAAVRSVRIEPAGGPSRVVKLAKAPLRVLCANPDEVASIDLSAPLDNPLLITPLGPLTTLASTPPVRIADGPDDTLCLAFAAAPLSALGCNVVSPYLSRARKVLDSTDSPRAFAVALPASVAAMRISTTRGPARANATLVPGGYGGRYAGRVRVAVAAISGYAELAKVDYLDATGRVLYREPASPVAALGDSVVSGPRRLAGRPGRPSLWQTSYSGGGATSRCLALTGGRAPARDAPCVSREPGLTALLSASCASRRLTVGVTAPAGARVTARLSKGRARAFTLLAGAGLLTLPSRAGLRSLTIAPRGDRARGLRVRAPSGAGQCGWEAALTR